MPPFFPDDHHQMHVQLDDDEDCASIIMTVEEDTVVAKQQEEEEEDPAPLLSIELEQEEEEEDAEDNTISEDNGDNDLDISIRRPNNKLHHFANVVVAVVVVADDNNNNGPNNDSRKEEEEEQEQEQYEGEEDFESMESQGYWYCGKTGFKKTMLSPIHERQVTFAAHVIKDEIDGGRVLSVLDAVHISPIPHVSEYTPEDKRNLWYTRKEMSNMKGSCVNAVRKISQHTELHCPFFFRGLERLIDDVINPHPNSSTTTDRRWDATVAVLQEQQEQRFLCAQMYGMVYGGMMDPEKVRHAYMTQGNTKRSQCIAHNLARQDEAHAKECLEEFVDDNNNKREMEYEDDDDDHHHHHHPKNALSNGVRSILQTLITPFFEMRHGDVYQGMGEDCF